MKSEFNNPALEAALKLKARRIADLETAISEFDYNASILDRQIAAEEKRTGITDPTDPAYSSFAESAAQRRNNLRASAASLRAALKATLGERDTVLERAEQ